MPELVTVETTGDFGLLDITSGYEVAAEGTSDVPLTNFIRERIDLGQLNRVEDEKPAAKKAAPKAS
jgi:hypothetical protein